MVALTLLPVVYGFWVLLNWALGLAVLPQIETTRAWSRRKWLGVACLLDLGTVLVLIPLALVANPLIQATVQTAAFEPIFGLLVLVARILGLRLAVGCCSGPKDPTPPWLDLTKVVVGLGLLDALVTSIVYAAASVGGTESWLG